MTKETAIKLFQDQKVRVHWDNDQEKWYFSIVDIIGVLTESENPRKYWSVLKTRLKKEGSEVATNCSRLKLLASDGKMRMTDVANTEQLLRLIQSIPSPKAEPFKLWLAKVGYERIEETEDPEKAFDRAMETYLKKGYFANWINQRIKSIEVRKELTDELTKAKYYRGAVCIRAVALRIDNANSPPTTRSKKMKLLIYELVKCKPERTVLQNPIRHLAKPLPCIK